MDEIDRNIIKLLQLDGRMADIEIARKIGVSDDTVKRRRKDLEKEGYISLSANVNPRAFGYTNVFTMGIILIPGSDSREIARRIASKKEFFFVALSLGPTYAIIAHCFAREQITLSMLVEELRTWKEIEKIETNIIYDVVRSEYHSIPVDYL